MQREWLLGGIAVGVVAATLLGTVLVPGVVASPEPDDPPADVGVREVSLSTGETSGDSATLQVDLRLAHDGRTARNVTVEFRAIDEDAGLVVDRRRVAVGNVSVQERRVLGRVTVPREGAYDVETVVYLDGRRVDGQRTRVSGLSGVTPDYVDSPVRFMEFRRSAFDFPTVEYAVTERSGGQATLDVSAYVTNGGRETAADVSVVFTVRESGSGAVLDRERTTVSDLQAGDTVAPSVSLVVPDGEDYYLDAVLRRDGTVLDTARSTADLDPNASLSVNRSAGSEGLQVGESENDGPADGEPTPTTTPTYSEGDSGPGFGVVVAVLALLAAAAVARRWDDG